MKIADATPGLAAKLTDLAIRAKASWGYEPAWLEMWKKDLTITPDFITKQVVKVAEENGEVIGFAALNLEDAEIDHFWIEPNRMRDGVGRALFTAIEAAMAANRVIRATIVSDPNAEGFYLRMGAQRIGEVESTPRGRYLPKLIYTLK